MSKYRLRFTTTIEIAVELEALDEIDADDKAWSLVNDYLNTLRGDSHEIVAVNASIDGIGAEHIEEMR